MLLACHFRYIHQINTIVLTIISNVKQTKFHLCGTIILDYAIHDFASLHCRPADG